MAPKVASKVVETTDAGDAKSHMLFPSGWAHVALFAMNAGFLLTPDLPIPEYYFIIIMATLTVYVGKYRSRKVGKIKRFRLASRSLHTQP